MSSNSNIKDILPLPDDSIPEVSVEECLVWLDEQIVRGRAAIAKLVVQARAEAAGELVPGAYDPKVMANLKYAAGLTIRARSALVGLVGSRPGVPAYDMDEMFFALISEGRGYDVTKGLGMGMVSA